MSNVAQIIVWRKDLKVHKGKIGAQVAHAAVQGFIRFMLKEYCTDQYGNEYIRLSTQYGKNSILGQWLEGQYTKIVLGCENESELLDLYKQAEDAGLPCCLITDNGLTEFWGVPTKTCFSIGPYEREEINKITGHLRPL